MEKVLIRGVNWLGDIVMSLPAIYLYKKKFPENSISVLTLAHLAAIYEYFAPIDEVITFQKFKGFKGLAKRFAMGETLRKEGFDRSFILPNSFDAALVPFIAGIPLRRGFSSQGRNVLLNDSLPPPRDYFKQHHSLHYGQVMGEGPFELEKDFSLLKVPHEVSEKTLKNFGVEGGDYIVVCPGAAYGPAKQWGEEKFFNLIKMIQDETNLNVVILGTKDISNKWSSLALNPKRTFNLIGKTSLKELIEIMSCAVGVICNDSGPMHLGGVLGIHVAAIFGSTSPLATSALGNLTKVFYHQQDCSPCLKRVCPQGHYKCLDVISVDEVFKGVKTWLP